MFIIFLHLIWVSACASQWRRIGSFEQPIGTVLVLDSGKNDNYTAFIGTDPVRSISDNASEVWRTINGGKNWERVYKALSSAEEQITGISFKDSLTGWFSSKDNGGCYKTIDGGKTWSSVTPPGTPQTFSSVYYHNPTKILFLSQWQNYGFLSFDEGNSWQIFGNSMNGVVFSDSFHGIASTVSNGGLSFNPYFRTTDGGFTWSKITFDDEAWQPVVYNNIFFAMCEYSRILYRSDDQGLTWNSINRFATNITGTICSDSKLLFIQSGGLPTSGFDNVDPQGILKSFDEGQSWVSICGPDNFIDTKFYISDYGIWAGDSLGGLWFNKLKKGSGPRLQIERDNSSRHVMVKSSQIVPINIYYSKDSYYESVDSLSLMVSYNDPLVYISDSVASGWIVKRREILNTHIKFILQRIDPFLPQTDSLLLKVYFETVIAREASARLTLDEINFNRDTTFRDCMVAALSQMDSFFVDIQDQCGDSTLREFLRNGYVPNKIISLRPNPAQDELELDLQSAAKQDATIEIFDALGTKVFSDMRSISEGLNSIRLDTKGLSGGVYLVRVEGASKSFVKVR